MRHCFVVVVFVLGMTVTARGQIPMSHMFVTPDPQTSGRFGRDVLLADLTGDGLSELLVGADGQNGEAGRVYIKIGPLSPMPSVVWYEIDKPVSPAGLDWFGFDWPPRT